MSAKFAIELSTRALRVTQPEAIPAPVRKALERREILERLEKATKAGKKPVAAARRILASLRRQGRPVGLSTLYYWKEDLKRHGLMGLLDGRSGLTPELAMDETCRRLLPGYIELMDVQGVAMLTIFAAMLAGRRGRVKTHEKKAKALGGGAENTVKEPELMPPNVKGIKKHKPERSPVCRINRAP